MKIVKIVAYLILLGIAAYSFQKFRKTHAEASNTAALRNEANALLADRNNGAARDGADTNAASAGASTADSPAAPSADSPKGAEPPKPESETPSDPAAGAPSADSTAAQTADNASSTNGPAKSGAPGSAAKPGPASASSQSWPVYLGLFLVSLITLALLLAWDVSRAAASRAHSAVFMENASSEKDPEYDEAEEVWKQGRFLDAINLLRDYLKKNPTEQFAAIRIAEIYEKDLNNPAVASMELEEVLSKRLPAEKWGWTAIHLANIYSGRLNQPERALDLLNRIIQEYPQTGAARKARSRLGIPEPEETAAPAAEEPAAPSEDTSAVASDDAPSGLPPGFRPKR